MVTIDLTAEEIEFLDEALRYGEDDYIRRAHQYAREAKRDKDKKYKEYFENKKNMFVLVRAKLILKSQLTNLEKQLTQKFKLRDTTEHNTVRINWDPDPEFLKHQEDKKEKEKTEFSFKRPKQNLKNNTSSFFPESLNDALDSLNYGAFYTDKEEERELEAEKLIHGKGATLDNEIWKELNDKDKEIINDNQRVFQCGACGKRRIKSKRLRTYHPHTLKHPILMEIADKELICSPCKSWDYDVMTRGRKIRSNLKLKNGLSLSVKEAKRYLDNEGYNFR